jgi:TusA-related sulfurtransferase
MSKIIVDVRGKSCPVPVVEVRKALRQAKEGDIIEVTGTNESSKGEIPMVAEAAGKKVDSIIEEENYWKIIIKC